MVVCVGSCCFYVYSHAQIKEMNNVLLQEAKIDAENVQKDNDYLFSLLEKHEKSEKHDKEDK